MPGSGRADINLSLHVEDVLAVFRCENLNEVVLAGHSYGGMVITGVADRIPERVAALVDLDAFLPQDGQTHLCPRHGIAAGKVRSRRSGCCIGGGPQSSRAEKAHSRPAIDVVVGNVAPRIEAEAVTRTPEYATSQVLVESLDRTGLLNAAKLEDSPVAGVLRRSLRRSP